MDAVLFSSELVATVLQSAVCFYLVRTVFKGVGTGGVPYGRRGIPEEKWLPITYCLLQATVHMLKAGSYLGNPGLDFTNLLYVDYLLSCPMILADMFTTMRLPGKLLAVVVCACSLLCAVVTFQTEGSARLLAFAFGCVMFICLVTLVFTRLRAVLPTLPGVAMKPLYVAMAMFFGMWPLFPLMWIVGPAGLGIMSTQVYIIIHVVLDLLCKSVFAVALQQFRCIMEDTGIFYTYTLLNPHFKAVVEANVASGSALASNIPSASASEPTPKRRGAKVGMEV